MLDPMARKHRAWEFMLAGRFAEALEDYLWCFDEGVKHQPSFVGVRGSFLVSEIAELGKRHPPAIAALRERRDRLEARLRAGTAERGEAQDYGALSQSLEESGRTLDMFDLGGEVARLQREELFHHVFDQLMERRRYRDVIESCGSIDRYVDHAIRVYTDIKALCDGPWGSINHQGVSAERMREVVREAPPHALRRAVTTVGKFYEALLGVGRNGEAAAVADRISKLDPSVDTFVALVRHAVRSGRPGAAADMATQARAALPADAHARIDEALASAPEGSRDPRLDR